MAWGTELGYRAGEPGQDAGADGLIRGVSRRLAPVGLHDDLDLPTFGHDSPPPQIVMGHASIFSNGLLCSLLARVQGIAPDLRPPAK